MDVQFVVGGKQYTVVRNLGGGIFHESYLVENENGRFVVKFFSAAYQAEFESQWNRWRQANVPNRDDLVGYLDGGVADGKPFILRHWVEEASFADYARQLKTDSASLQRALAVGQFICRAVAALHQAGLVHGHISNANVFFDPVGSPTIVDPWVGMVTPQHAHAAREKQAARGILAPEQQQASGKIDARTDVWELGLLLCRLYTRQPDLVVNPRILMELNAAKLPMPLIKVLWQAIQQEPSSRFTDAATLATALSETLLPEHQKTVYVRPVPVGAKGARDGFGTRTRMLALLVFIFVALIGIGLWYYNHGKSSQAPPPPVAAIPAPRPTPQPTPTPRPTPTSGSTTMVPALRDPLTLDLGSGITMRFQWIPPGKFYMGSPEFEPGHASDESPETRVTLSQGFWIGESEVTQAQWTAITGNNPSHFKGDSLPVESVSWNDANAYCQALAARVGRAASLPTEAQWEFACRSRAPTRFAIGNANDSLLPVAWMEANGGGATHPVMQKDVNSYGLYDMHGNVWEWCAGVHGKYPGGEVTDPTGPPTGAQRVMRGGGWGSSASECRAANRNPDPPDFRQYACGLRVVLPGIESDGPDMMAAPPPPPPSAEPFVLDVAPGISMRFRWVPPGSFIIGSPAIEKNRQPNEGPQTRVTISKGYWMGETEVTQAQWYAVMRTNPSTYKGEDLPVQEVSWHSAVNFCRTLSARTGRTIYLPKEAEWEYACRAGTITPFSAGSNGSAVGEFGWDVENAAEKPQHVGQKKPNPAGFYDMHGNVWEWCWDYYSPNYPGGSVTDPEGPPDGTLRVGRGGSVRDMPPFLRSATRISNDPDFKFSNIGFRVMIPTN